MREIIKLLFIEIVHSKYYGDTSELNVYLLFLCWTYYESI